VTKDDIIAELDAKLQIPGVRNGWTQPIINRINMLSTGVRTDLGVKFFGTNLDTLERLAIEAEALLRTVPGAADLYAERTQGGLFLDIDINRKSVARYGVNVGDVLELIETAIGGDNFGTIIEGRQRFPLRVRYGKDWRDNVNKLAELPVPVGTAAAPGSGPMVMGATRGTGSDIPQRYIPLGQLAEIQIVPGPPMISSEDAQLRSIVYLNVRGRDMGSFVEEAKDVLENRMTLPSGYTLQWSGQWENQIRARDRLTIVIPVVLLVIFVMLYFVTKDFAEAFVVMLSVPFALIGGVYLVALLGYNFSVAVWVGFIALYGLAVETGVVMVVYLHEALDRRIKEAQSGKRDPLVLEDIREATIEGSVLRLRPKVMTVMTSLIGLIPIMWSTGVGADVMQPLAAPMIGGLITSTIHVLVVTPLLFSIMKERALKKGRLELSSMAGWMK
jgi:Cu(I)/Ag(I) efflux system membrane protein CusA/SilA